MEKYRSGLSFAVADIKLARHEEDRGVKSEFGFDTDAAVSRSVAKRMFELLTPLSSSWRESSSFPLKNRKTQAG